MVGEGGWSSPEGDGFRRLAHLPGLLRTSGAPNALCLAPVEQDLSCLTLDTHPYGRSCLAGWGLAFVASNSTTGKHMAGARIM